MEFKRQVNEIKMAFELLVMGSLTDSEGVQNGAASSIVGSP